MFKILYGRSVEAVTYHRAMHWPRRDVLLATSLVAVLVSGCTDATGNQTATSAAPGGGPTFAAPVAAGPPPADRSIEMVPGTGANATVEATLVGLVDDYVPGTGIHVASYDGSDGRLDIYEFQTLAAREAVADRGSTVVCRLVVERGATQSNGYGCGEEAEGERPSRGILNISIDSSDGTSSLLAAVGSQVSTLVVEFDNGLVYSVKPEGGTAYATWRWGTGELAGVTAYYPDGTSESQSFD